MTQKSGVLLSDEVSQGASEEDRRALEQLSKAIEKVREDVRPQYGKARSYPRGFHTADRDFVDNLAWHEVLTRHGADVMVECVGTGLKAEQLVDLVREHCSVPWATQDALMWMSVCYRAIPRAHRETLAIAMREHEKQRIEHFSSMGKSRLKHARKKAIELANSVLEGCNSPPSRAFVVTKILDQVCVAARDLDKDHLVKNNAKRTIDGWVKDGIDPGRFKSRH